MTFSEYQALPGVNLPEEPSTSVAQGAPEDDLAPPGHAGPWQPLTIRDVEWSLERIGEAEAERAEILDQMTAAMDAIRKRAIAIVEKAERRAEWFRAGVEEWAKAHRDEVVRGKLKTRELLGGSIAFRSSAEKVVITDEAATIAWAELGHLELLDLKPKIDRRALSRFVLTTGEVPPGVDVTPATETVHVKSSPLPTLNAAPARKEIP